MIGRHSKFRRSRSSNFCKATAFTAGTISAFIEGTASRKRKPQKDSSRSNQPGPYRDEECETDHPTRESTSRCNVRRLAYAQSEARSSRRTGGEFRTACRRLRAPRMQHGPPDSRRANQMLDSAQCIQAGPTGRPSRAVGVALTRHWNGAPRFSPAPRGFSPTSMFPAFRAFPMQQVTDPKSRCPRTDKRRLAIPNPQQTETVCEQARGCCADRDGRQAQDRTLPNDSPWLREILVEH